MGLMVKTRLGFGFDFEYEEELCYRVGVVYEDGTEDEDLVGFVGNVLRIPFLIIFIGEFRSLTEEEDNEDHQQDVAESKDKSKGDGEAK